MPSLCSIITIKDDVDALLSFSRGLGGEALVPRYSPLSKLIVISNHTQNIETYIINLILKHQ